MELYDINYLRDLKGAMENALAIEYDYFSGIDNPMDFKAILDKVGLVDTEEENYEGEIFTNTKEQKFSDFLSRYSNQLFGSSKWVNEDAVLKMLKTKDNYYITVPNNPKTFPLDLQWLSLNVFTRFDFTVNNEKLIGIINDRDGYPLYDYNKVYYPNYIK